MLFTMIYPFLHIVFHSVSEILQRKNNKVERFSEDDETRFTKKILVNFHLNFRVDKILKKCLLYVMPGVGVTVFIVFWTLGLLHHHLVPAHSDCK